MDPEHPPRKLRFKPKPQKQRTRKPADQPKAENAENDDDLAQQQLESSRPQQPKAENKSSVQVTSTNAAKELTTTRASYARRCKGRKKDSELDLMQLDEGIGQSSEPSSSTPGTHVVNRKDSTSPKIKEYRDPWDHTSYYPTTHPWRKLGSGNPEILDEAEFGEAACNVEYDETTINSASELKLSNPDETSNNDRLMFFQLPFSLPVMKRFASGNGKEKEGSLPPLNPRKSTAVGLADLPAAGQMGKLLVYKSGAVKLKLGETLYNVSPGLMCPSYRDVAAINTKNKEFCEIGHLDGQAIVTPDIDGILDSMTGLG